MSTSRIRNARFAFVDVETTGIDPAIARVVEVAAQIVDRGEVIATFESLVDPGCTIPEFVTAIHGIDDGMVRGQPTLDALTPLLLDHCRDAVIVAHNAAFDRRFLPFLAALPSACSYRLAARVVPEAPNHRNQTLRAFFNVRDPLLRGGHAHRALADVVVTRHVFFHCLDRYLAAGHDDALDALYTFLQPRSRQRVSAASACRE